MSAAPADLLLILGLGLATYATRAGGFWLARRVRPGPFVAAWLRHLPGAVLAALVAPMAVAAGPAGWGAAVLGFALMRWPGRFLLAMVAGLAAFVLLRELTGS